jgi:CYTH domain-containing protein/predicted NAD-dependent protein-ADP-ribosyltransferase YbiA (DUF1768 family)
MSKITEIAFTKSSAPYGWMGNMSRFVIVHEEQAWGSTEALFQALRFPEDSPIREEIRLALNGYDAKQVAKANRTKMSVVPTSEEDLDNMRLCIRLKIEQHTHLKDILMGSEDIPIYEDVTKRGEGNSNLIWGAIKQEDGSWKGDNIMGVLWMELRQELCLEFLDKIHPKELFNSESNKAAFDMVMNRGEKVQDETEIERRFLLKSLPKLVEFNKSIIIQQHYLSEKGSNIVERVRKSERRFDVKPIKRYHTTKERISDMSVREIEKEITEKEFNNYLITKGIKRTISKTRYIKDLPDNLKWEVDKFEDVRLIIAEIEIPNEDYDLKIPEWLEPYIIMEITGMHQFSNSNLAE